MNLAECYRILEIRESSTDEEITRSYKRLAHLYHPDKNRDRIEWATRAMANLNIAYTTVTGHRFSISPKNGTQTAMHDDTARQRRAAQRNPASRQPAADYMEDLQDDIAIQQFIRARENAKDGLYRYFQYGLYNLFRRENIINRGIFSDIVNVLRKCYHDIKKLSTLTKDEELLEHFSVFNKMIFNFYRASECLNIPDSYSNILDVEAFRLYKKGDEALHLGHHELFYERHNRGCYKKEIAEPNIIAAEYYFNESLKHFPESTWAVETRIKLDYVHSLKKYIALFFTSDTP